MFSNLTRLFENGETLRAVLAILSAAVILGLMSWISVIDIIKQRIVFWKLLITGGAAIILPTLVTLTTGQVRYTLWLVLAVPLWMFLLSLNIRFNKERFIGKADIDIITAPFSLLLAYTFYLMRKYEADVAGVYAAAALYEAFKYLLFGSIVYLVIYIVVIILKVAVKKDSSFKKFIKEHKVSMLPMLVPYTVYAAYLVMTAI